MPCRYMESKLSDTGAIRCRGHCRVERSATARARGADHPGLWARRHRDDASDSVERFHRCAVAVLLVRQGAAAAHDVSVPPPACESRARCAPLGASPFVFAWGLLWAEAFAA